MTTKDDEAIVVQYLTKRRFRCTSFTKAERRRGKTPDFRVYREDDFLFFCEAKSIASDKWLGGTRSDPIPNRISADIHDAVQQFDAVNLAGSPNVLAILNHDHECDSDDLISVLTGNAYTKDGSILPIYRSYSEGRIRNEKLRIHLFLWFSDEEDPKFIFTESDEVHHQNLCKWFDVAPSMIPRLPK